MDLLRSDAFSVEPEPPHPGPRVMMDSTSGNLDWVETGEPRGNPEQTLTRAQE